MDAERFRQLALSLPEAVEAEHMDHPDFRVRGKIFATLHADGERGVVMLTPEQQAAFVTRSSGVFEAVPGAWGRRGATMLVLRRSRVTLVREALESAWRNKAPKSLG